MTWEENPEEESARLDECEANYRKYGKYATSRDLWAQPMTKEQVIASNVRHYACLNWTEEERKKGRDTGLHTSHNWWAIGEKQRADYCDKFRSSYPDESFLLTLASLEGFKEYAEELKQKQEGKQEDGT